MKATHHLMKANFPNGTSTTNVTDALTGKSELMKASDHVAETINVALNVRIRIAFIGHVYTQTHTRNLVLVDDGSQAQPCKSQQHVKNTIHTHTHTHVYIYTCTHAYTYIHEHTQSCVNQP